MTNKFLALLGTGTKSSQWQQVCAELQISPQVLKYPNGYWIVTFEGHGLEVYLANHTVASVVFYGPQTNNSIGSFSDELVANLSFEKSESSVDQIIGKPVYRRLESPLGESQKCIKANFYKFGEHCLIARFDERFGNAMTYLECMEYKTASKAHGFK